MVLTTDRGAARWRRCMRVAIAGASALLVLLAGCSSSGSKAPASSSTGGAPSSGTSATGSASSGGGATGSPIKVMTITSINSQGPVFPMIGETAQIFAKAVAAKGGINGHPLQVDVCDDQGQPTQASACARKAVQEHDVAVVGSYSFFGDNIVPILAAAKIPWFGTCCAGTPQELTSTDSFPVGSSLMYAVGFVQRAISDGCKHISAVVIDGAQPYIEPMQNAMKAAGRSFVGKPIILPQTSQDDSSFVAQATKGADCILMVVSETLWKPWFAAYRAAGATARLYGPQGNLDAVSIKGFEDVANGSVIAGSFPDISTAPWADYRAALMTYNAPTTYDYNSLGGLGTWAGYTAFQQIVSKVAGPITANAFLKAASTTTDLNLNGMVPPIDFTKPWMSGLQGYQRLFNRSVYFSTVKNGKVVPLSTTPVDVSNLALGKAS